MRPLPNRLAVYATALGALALGLVPLIGNLDWTSTAGILGAIAAIAGVVAVWLLNWGKYERGEGAGLLPGDELDELETDYTELEDGFDEATAEPVPAATVQAAHTPEQGTTYTPADELDLEAPGTGAPPMPPAIPPGPRPARGARREP